MREALRLLVFQRDNFTCRYCGVRHEEVRWYDHDRPSWCGGPRWIANLHVDHVVPRCKGGTDDMDNLVTACPDCNLEKYDRTPSEWLVA